MGTIFSHPPSEYVREVYPSFFDLELLRKKFGHKTLGFRMEYARSHPAIFAWFMLGKKLRPYQCFALDKILFGPSKRVALCTSRRLGKTTMAAVLAFWITYFNKFPKNNVEKFSEFGVVSKDDDSAKKVLSMVRELLMDGDKHMSWLLKKNKKHNDKYFSEKLSEPSNTEVLTWHNRSRIVSLPPTKKVRSKGFSFLWFDEIAFAVPSDRLSLQDFFESVCLPTIADTDGYCVVSSTPNGVSNYFFDLFDPYGELDSPFLGIHYSWEVNKDDPSFCKFVNDTKFLMERDGRKRLFDQEYEGVFVTTQDSFFSPELIDEFFSERLCEEYVWKKSKCSIGIDYGVKNCLTVITVKTRREDGVIVTLYRRAFSPGYDINNLLEVGVDDGIPQLLERYDVGWIVPDDCVQAKQSVDKMLSKGWNVVPYAFSTSDKKNFAFYNYKGLLRRGLLKCFVDEKLKKEMLGVKEEMLVRHVRIGKSSPTSFDDRVDSEVFATIPFFDDYKSECGVMRLDEGMEGVSKKLNKESFLLDDVRVDKQALLLGL